MNDLTLAYKIWLLLRDHPEGLTTAQIGKVHFCFSLNGKLNEIAKYQPQHFRKVPGEKRNRPRYIAIGKVGPMKYSGSSNNNQNRDHPDFVPPKRRDVTVFADVPYGVLENKALNAFLGIRV